MQPRREAPVPAFRLQRMPTDAMPPIVPVPGDGGFRPMDGGEETAAPSDSEPLFQQHDPQHLSLSGLLGGASTSPTATGGADASQRQWRPRITQSDWNIHRETIVYLYRDCMQPLNRVREIMESEFGFFATERMYKHRFKQWRMFKYAKQGHIDRHHRDQDDEATQSPPSQAVVRRPRNAYPATVATSLTLPGSLRDLEVCMNHLQSFVLAICGDSKQRPRTVDPTPEMALSRSSWCFSVNHAVLQIHQGHLSTGFRLLDTAFGEFRRDIHAQDTGLLVRTASCLSLFADNGLPGLATVFLQFAHHALSLELSPTHPFCYATRQIQAAASEDVLIDAAWDLVGRYSELLWDACDPSPTVSLSPGPIPVLAELSWDLSRGVERDFMSPLAVPSRALGWASNHFSLGMSVAQLHLTQRNYGGARRAVEDLLAGLDPAAEPLDVALAYRKLWQISRAQGRHARSCADAETYVDFCRTSLGPDHYMTARAVQDYENYLRGWCVANNMGTVARVDLEENTALPHEPEE